MFKRLVSIVTLSLLTLMLPVTAFASSYDAITEYSIEGIIDHVNKEYGTSLRLATLDEVLLLSGDIQKRTRMSEQELQQFEQELINVAQNVVPQIEQTTNMAQAENIKNGNIVDFDALRIQHEKEAKDKVEQLHRENISVLESSVQSSVSGSWVNLRTPIDGATAEATGDTEYNSSGSRIWTRVSFVGCRSNDWATADRVFSGTATASIIDLGRTIYWSAYGDYYTSILGFLVYAGSGSQYTYWYATYY